MNLLTLLVSALGQGMIYAPMALGVFVAFRILNTPDLTIDGSFVAGMCTCAVVTIAGSPVLGIFCGMAAGALAGLVTGLLQTRLKINALLSGILTMTGLYTINFMLLGGRAGDALILLLTAAALAVFFRTRTGLAIRATGDNEEMVRSSSINADRSRVIGIMISNALVALSGALLCEQQRYADLNFGSGMLVVGLASVIIGQVFFGLRGVTIGIVSAVAGSLVYRVILQFAYKVEMPSYAVKLLSAVIVVIALTIPRIKRLVDERRAEREEADS